MRLASGAASGHIPGRPLRCRIRLARSVDLLRSRKLQQLLIESPKAKPVVEITQVREFVAQRADQTGVAQWSARDGVAKSDLDHPVVVTDAKAAGYVGALGFDRAVAETESPTDVLSIAVEPFDQGAVRLAFRHSPASLPLVSRMVKVRDAAAMAALHTFDWVGEPAANFF